MDNGKTPWDMPYEIFWDIRPLASVRRALWALQNVPDLERTDVIRILALHRAEYPGWIPEIELLEIVLDGAPVSPDVEPYYEKLFPDPWPPTESKDK